MASSVAFLECQPGASSGRSPPSPDRCYTAKDCPINHCANATTAWRSARGTSQIQAGSHLAGLHQEQQIWQTSGPTFVHPPIWQLLQRFFANMGLPPNRPAADRSKEDASEVTLLASVKLFFLLTSSVQKCLASHHVQEFPLDNSSLLSLRVPLLVRLLLRASFPVLSLMFLFSNTRWSTVVDGAPRFLSLPSSWRSTDSSLQCLTVSLLCPVPSCCRYEFHPFLCRLMPEWKFYQSRSTFLSGTSGIWHARSRRHHPALDLPSKEQTIFNRPCTV